MSLQANVCNVSATPDLHNTSDDTMGFWAVFGGVIDAVSNWASQIFITYSVTQILKMWQLQTFVVFATGVVSYAWFSQLGTKDATQREEIASKERIRDKEMETQREEIASKERIRDKEMDIQRDAQREEIASKERIQREQISARREENAIKEQIAWMRMKVDLELANGADSSQRRHRIHSHGSQDNFLAAEPQGSRVELLD